MAWNPSPKVAVARDAAQKLNRDMVVMFVFDAASGTYESRSATMHGGLLTACL